MNRTLWMLAAVMLAATLIFLAGCGEPEDPAGPNQSESVFEVLDTTPTRGFAVDMSIAGDVVYVAEQHGGIGSYSIADPSNITAENSALTDDRADLVHAVPEMNALIVSLRTINMVYWLDSLTVHPSSIFGSSGVTEFVTDVIRDTVESDFWFKRVETDVIRMLMVDVDDQVRLGSIFVDSTLHDSSHYFFTRWHETLGWPQDILRGVTALDDSLLTVAAGARDYGVVFGRVVDDGEWYTDINTPGEVYSLTNYNGYLYIADGVGGMSIIDARDPMNPELVSTWKREGVDHVIRVAVNGGNAIVVDEFDGIYLLDVTDPTAPIFIEAYEMRSPTDALFIDSNTIIVSSELDGLTTFHLDVPEAFITD